MFFVAPGFLGDCKDVLSKQKPNLDSVLRTLFVFHKIPVVLYCPKWFHDIAKNLLTFTLQPTIFVFIIHIKQSH